MAQVGTAEEAVEKAAQADLVLIESAWMPPDGVEAAILIRDRYHVPVIFLTANADRATVDHPDRRALRIHRQTAGARRAGSSSIEIAMYSTAWSVSSKNARRACARRRRSGRWATPWW